MCMPSNKRKRKISNQNKKKLPSDIDLILIKIWFNVRQCIALQQGIRIYFNVLSSRLTYLPFYKACGRTPGLMPRDKKGKEGEKKRIFKKKNYWKWKTRKGNRCIRSGYHNIITPMPSCNDHILKSTQHAHGHIWFMHTLYTRAASRKR